MSHRYRFLDEIGSGAFGAVVAAVDTHTGQTVAIKKLQRSDECTLERVDAELLNHRSLNHPHVIKFQEVFLSINHINVVMEYANAGSLFDYVRQRKRLNEQMARWFFQQLTLAVDYCHKRGVCNRDIKLENILLQSLPGVPKPLLKLCDFGFSKMMGAAADMSSVVGTIPYMPPEVIQGCGFGRSRQPYDGRAVDVWSCGVVLYCMLVGSYPFGDKLSRHMLQSMNSQSFQLPERLPPEVVSLLKQLLHPSPEQRISIESILAHPWFTQDLPPRAAELNGLYLARGCVCAQPEEEIVQIVAVAAAANREQGAAKVGLGHPSAAAADVVAAAAPAAAGAAASVCQDMRLLQCKGAAATAGGCHASKACTAHCHQGLLQVLKHCWQRLRV